MKNCILDASVVIKWFCEEELQNEACQFQTRIEQRDITVIVPELFYIEISSICLKKKRKEVFDWRDMIKASERVRHLPFDRYPDHEIADVALENALQYEISAYDAMYISLAEIYGWPLVTADKALFDVCKKKEFPWIEWLGDLKA